MEKTLKIKLVKSLNGRLEKQIATAYSLGLKKIGQTTDCLLYTSPSPRD